MEIRMGGWGSLNLEILRGGLKQFWKYRWKRGSKKSAFRWEGEWIFSGITQSCSQLEKNTARAVTKICCWVNTTRRLGIKQVRISFGSIFLLFSYESSWGKSPAPNT